MADVEANNTQAATKKTVVYENDENKERGNWSGKLDFVLSMLGFAVGLGNIWRFPYLCYRNGGGAFLLPYLLMLGFVGIPLFYLEVTLGQFCSKGAAQCWDFAPMFKGVGVASITCSTLVSIYYNVIIAWAQFYFVVSFTNKLPWEDCEREECSKNWPIVDCTTDTMMDNGTCYNSTSNAYLGVYNTSIFEDETGIKIISPSEEYWKYDVLNLSSGLSDLGPLRWRLLLSLVVAWVLCFLCLLKGIKTTGKVVYFTALFPYVVLVILLVRGVTLDNAWDGIKFYIEPKFDKLTEAKVWRDAANQIFYSLGPCWGGLITLASYNRFHNNALRDTLIVGFGNSLTSLFGGFVIFSYLGYMAAKLNKDVGDVVTSGPGLAFIVYPEAVTQLPAPPFWSLAFFFMLILLGLDSQFTMVETVLSGFLDQWPQYRSKKTLVLFFISIAMFLLGLPLVTEGGAYMLTLMDTYAASWSLMIVGIIQLLLISYLYGIKRFYKDMSIMYGSEPSLWWKFCWMFLSPALILFILVFAGYDYSRAMYGDDYKYSDTGEVLGWLMVAAAVFWIPALAIFGVLTEKKGDSIWEKIRIQMKPNARWGPALVEHRKLVDYVPGFLVDPDEKEKSSYFNPVVFDDPISYNGNEKAQNGHTITHF